MKTHTQFRVTRFLSLLPLVASVALAGCGGGSISTRSASPNATTRAQVTQKIGAQNSTMNLTGFQSTSAAVSNAGNGGVSAGNTTSSIEGISSNIGAYIRYHFAKNGGSKDGTVLPLLRSRAYHAKHTRDANSDYDDYLGYYQTVTETTGKTTVALFTDAAKTQPAGSIVVTYSVDASTFPQFLDDTYTFTAGSQAGTKGSYRSSTNADSSGATTYSAIDANGNSYTGSYTTASDFSYTWQSRTEKGATFFQYQGAFKSDGSGTASSSDSDGYQNSYVYNSDGSYTGTIAGPDPGLPATVTYTIDGTLTTRYADGTTTSFNYFNGTGDSGSSDGNSGK